ncbi:ATP-grasp domain-containing protein [Catellatospora sp. KI3]|uniref:ATP-grasp domain-containing protein n=1 Tax=Catellatospora sp. KI3 TaxID=3041620 RepID=UPI0024828568|nr:ATP-grasp domain-containing protein [Catellatospora sp. KI3]MDI1461045.1 ATP-grasp domain-containing protein [Catellatospora sp. KI3]
MTALVLSNHNDVLEKGLHAAGHDVIVCLTKANARDRAQTNPGYDVVAVSDWQSYTELAQLADHLRGRIDRVETCWEGAIMAAGLLRDLLDLPGLTLHQSAGFLDKAVMKRRLTAAGIDVARHRVVTAVDQVPDAAEHVGGWPLVLKPLTGFASTNTYVIDSPDELRRMAAAGLFDTATPTSTAFAAERAFLGLGQQAAILVEEYIDVVTEYHADALWQDGVALYHLPGRYNTPPLTGMGATLGSWLIDRDSADGSTVVDIAAAAAKALGMRTGFTHAEIFHAGDGRWLLGEIAARVGGGGIQQTIAHAHGIDVPTLMSAVAAGRSVIAAPMDRPGVYGWAGTAVLEGTVESCADVDTIRRHPAVIDATVAVRLGMRGGATSTGLWAGLAGIAYLHTDDVAAMREAISAVPDLYALTMRTQP